MGYNTDMKKPLPTQALLRAVLDYDADTGIFRWKRNPAKPERWNSRWAGAEAGALKPSGYVIVTIDYELYRAHRLAWVYVNGDVLAPEDEIDHVDGVRSHNWIGNLRPATKTQNMANSAGWKERPAQGLPKGVFMCRSKFQASIFRNGKKMHLGTFDTAEEAHAAYLSMAAAVDGEFARAG